MDSAIEHLARLDSDSCRFVIYEREKFVRGISREKVLIAIIGVNVVAGAISSDVPNSVGYLITIRQSIDAESQLSA